MHEMHILGHILIETYVFVVDVVSLGLRCVGPLKMDLCTSPV